MKYLLIIITLCFIFSFTASARDWDYRRSQDQLRAVAWGAGTYLLADQIRRGFKVNRTRAMLASGLLAGSAAYIIDHYANERNKQYKTQGAFVGIGMAWTVSFGLGL